MKKFYSIISLAIAMAMPCSAQSNVGIIKAPNSKVVATIEGGKNTKFVSNKEHKTLTSVSRKRPAVQNGEQYVTLNINPICSENEMVYLIRVIPTTDFPEERWDIEETELSNLPVGSYDILVCFYDEETNEVIFIMKENVNITCDTTIDVNANDAQPIVYTAYNPDGVPFVLNKYDFDEEGNQIMVEKGNIDHVCSLTQITRKSDFADIFMNMGYDGFNYRMNQLSDRFICSESLFYYNDGDDACYYVNKFYLNGDDKLLVNNPKDYIYHEESFVSSKVGENSKKTFGCNFNVAYNGDNVIMGTIEGISSDVAKIWVNSPIEPISKTERIDLLVRPVIDDNLKIDVYNITDPDGNIVFSIETPIWQRIFAPNIAIENGIKNYVNNGPVAELHNFLTMSNKKQKIYPGNSIFSFAESQKRGKLGDNTPINLFYLGGWAYEGIFTPELFCSFLGRYGESREVDKYNSDLTVAINGNTISSFADKEINCINMNAFFSPWENPDRETGVVELTIDNKNVMVDGMQGYNLTKVRYDETKEDSFVPTMTMLQMRDTSGNVTDRFEKAADGKMTFSCGDFNYKLFADGFSGWYDCTLPQVEAFASVNGKEEWTPLTIAEDVEAFAMPGFGHVFNADLSQIEGEGWFDLKFRLTDASGNYQEQVVSPAFRIGNNAVGISDIKSASNIAVGRYTIDGRAITAPQRGINIIKMSDGTVRKEIVR